MGHKKWVLVALLLAVLAGPACALEGWLLKVREGIQKSAQSPSTSIPPQQGITTASTPTLTQGTLFPTMTPNPLPTKPQPTATIAPSSEADARFFRLELSEEELAIFVTEQSLGQGGLSLSDVRIAITEEQVIIRLDASHAESGLRGEITIITVPHVVEGTLYLKILDYRLGESLSGFARLIASALVKAALENYSTPDGIPVPIAGVAEIYTVELHPGSVVLTGRFQ